MDGVSIRDYIKSIVLTTIFSYCIPFDDGAAPNPFWGVCTLVICKPVIRRKAAVGDWVIGTGSKNSPVGDIGGRVVYAMRVTSKMTMKEYDEHTRRYLVGKIPDKSSLERKRWLGDSIYDFSVRPPKQREGVHTKANIATDLGGKFALLSTDFAYFGSNPVQLPHNILGLVKQGQGHQSKKNHPYVVSFVKWYRNLPSHGCVGVPQMNPFKDLESARTCAEGRCRDAEVDEGLELQGRSENG